MNLITIIGQDGKMQYQTSNDNKVDNDMVSLILISSKKKISPNVIYNILVEENLSFEAFINLINKE